MKNFPQERPIVVDIRHPRNRKTQNSRAGYFSRAGWLPKEKLKIKPRSRFLKFALLVIVFLPVAAAGTYSAYLWVNKDEAISSAHGVFNGLRLVRDQVFNLETDLIAGSIADIDSDLNVLERITKYLKLLPVLSEIPDSVSQTKELVAKMDSINRNVEELKNGGLGIMFEGSDRKLLHILKNIRTDIEEAQVIINDLVNKISKFDNKLISLDLDYIAFNSNIGRFSEGLDALISILERPHETHFALVFENPTEIRPGGGFAGSFGDLVIKNGEISKLEVDDIYHPDKFSDYKIIPPLQLQGLTTNWGSRDSSWFFDYPTSGRKFIELLEASDLYKDEGIKFDGAIAINVRVMEGLLDIIGDIEVPEYDLVLNSDNFLEEIQWMVEEGPDKRPGHNPKKVLSHIAPILIEKLKSIPDDKKEEILEIIGDHFVNKDIKFYFKDKTLQSIVKQYGLAGEVFEIPSGFNGDYLAIVNANIAGGKSDAFISQEINFDSVIDANGEVMNSLKVTRSHSGQNEKDWWYRADNKNYMKIFTLPKSKLGFLEGGQSKTIKPQINYGENDYSVDPDLAKVEGTLSLIPGFDVQRYEEFGKTSYGIWFTTPAGKTRTLEMTYFNSKKIIPKEGTKYTFVFDKQSGIESNFKYTVETPPGFVWLQSGERIYSYSSNSLPARLVLELTLISE